MTNEQLKSIQENVDFNDVSIHDVIPLLAEVERLKNELAMVVQVSGELCEKCGWAMKFPKEKCRCDLLAEVERLTADPLPAADWVREVERAAFQRGVAAMREAAAQYAKDFCYSGHAQSIRALPDPEDK